MREDGWEMQSRFWISRCKNDHLSVMYIFLSTRTHAPPYPKNKQNSPFEGPISFPGGGGNKSIATPPAPTYQATSSPSSKQPYQASNVRFRPPSHRHANPGDAEGIEDEEGFFPTVVDELDVVVEHHFRHDEFQRDRGVESTGAFFFCVLVRKRGRQGRGRRRGKLTRSVCRGPRGGI